MNQKLTILIFIFCAKLFAAAVSVPYFFADNMVLQRDSKIPVWGFANPGEKITVTFKNQKKTAIADQSGNWKLVLNEEKFGGPFTMKISGTNEIILQNILIGDVWLCSGQSNMEWDVARSDGYQNELDQSAFPLIRQIKINKAISNFLQKNIEKAEWKVANKATVGEFSGVAYFFAKKMFQETKIPVGIINSSWGGTNIETWISREAFENSADFKTMISKMPKISIDSLLKQANTAKISAIEKKLNSKITVFDQNEFLNENFDDGKLPEIKQPLIWEAQGFADLDGIVWLRKTFFLTPGDLQQDAKIFLGKIDDGDETFFNGVKIGDMNQYDADRVYTVPKNILKAGKNTIAIKVTDTSGGGGIWGENENVKLVTSKNTFSLAGNWKFREAEISKTVNENSFPSLVYNAMIAPLIPYKIKGILWYQGESNADRAAEYNKSFPILINSWRDKFGKDLPFYFVQLATFATAGTNSNEGSSWAELREAQTNALQLKNTGMVVTTDIGNSKDIHPTNKKSVGERLANLALKNGIVSPILNDFTVSADKIIVSFKPELKLTTSDNTEFVRGFEIAGSDHVFYPASAKIAGERVEVFSEKVKKPVAVRFGWKGDASENNLVTEQNLPVSPFRTDDFAPVTKNSHYQIVLQ